MNHANHILVFALTATLSLAGVAAALADDAAPASHVLQFKAMHVKDQTMQQEAFSLLVPSGWQVKAGVVWRPVPTHPATAELRLTSPDGRRQFEVLPQMPFVDGVREAQMAAARPAGPVAVDLIAAACAEGKRSNGDEIRKQVQSPGTFIREFVLPRFRADLRDAHVVKEDDLSAVAQQMLQAHPAEQGTQKAIHVGRTRIEFTVNGQPHEEDIYCVLVFIEIPVVHTTFWSADHLMAFRAPKGELDGVECQRIFQTMTHSFHINLDWFNRYTQVAIAMMQQKIKADHVMMEASRQWAQTSSQVTDDMRKHWEKQQADSDALNLRRDQQIRDVDEYKDSQGNRVELPSGYRNAWVDHSGDNYIVSDNTLFNPNVDLKDAGNWTQMEMVQH